MGKEDGRNFSPADQETPRRVPKRNVCNTLRNAQSRERRSEKKRSLELKKNRTPATASTIRLSAGKDHANWHLKTEKRGNDFSSHFPPGVSGGKRINAKKGGGRKTIEINGYHMLQTNPALLRQDARKARNQRKYAEAPMSGKKEAKKGHTKAFL